jgi:hypothetical protein
MAQLLIYRLREQLAPGCLPFFTSDGLNAYFYTLTAHFGHWLKQECRKQTACQWHGETGLMYAQVQRADLWRESSTSSSWGHSIHKL